MEESNDSITPLSTDPATPLTESQPKSGFQQRKLNCLSKRDKSSAGRIDPRAVQICHSINALEDYYTLSSCAGRCFLYRGKGIKNTIDFERFRVNHDLCKSNLVLLGACFVFRVLAYFIGCWDTFDLVFSLDGAGAPQMLVVPTSA